MRCFEFKMSLLALILANTVTVTLLLMSPVARSQNPEWMNFYSVEVVNALADDGEYLWGGGF